MPRFPTPLPRLLLLLTAASFAPPALAEDVAPGPAFQEGDVLGYEDLEKLEPYLPPEFWRNRDFFFFEGMRLEIGPTQRDYSPAKVYREATERHRGQARIGPDGSLENYTAGRPFPMDEIDCQADPDAGTKIMWNFVYTWGPIGGLASFYYSYWDRGEQLPLYYEGHGGGVALAHRPEPQYGEDGGDVFRKEKRRVVTGAEVTGPFDARGIKLLTYRYKSGDGPLATAQNDDTWVYLPMLRRVRRISTAQRTDAISGTDFTLDDLRSFNGVVPQYEWTCLREAQIISPSNTRVKGYPYVEDHNFGPYGLSFADDRWELRDAVVVRMVPKNDDHPYSYKDIYIDKQTLTAMYSFAYDQKDELWKIIWHNKRWSEDTRLTGEPYPSWDGVDAPRVHTIVCDIITNVQTGTGNRIEFWDSGTDMLMHRGRIRRYIDLGRLTRGR